MQLIVKYKSGGVWMSCPMVYSSKRELEEEIDKRIEAVTPIKKEIATLVRKSYKIEAKEKSGVYISPADKLANDNELQAITDRLDELYHLLLLNESIEPNIPLPPLSLPLGFLVSTNKNHKPQVLEIDEWFDTYCYY